MRFVVAVAVLVAAEVLSAALAGCGVDGAAPADSGTADVGALDASTVDASVDVAADAPVDAPLRCTLTASGPVVVTKNGQVVEKLRITASGVAGIKVSGFSDVIIRDVEILHAGAGGIELDNADRARVENVAVTHTGAPAAGPNASADRNNIVIYQSTSVTVDGARLTRGSTGIYLLESPKSVLRHVEGHDFRGPLPRGQLVQWDKSDDGLLELFSVENPSNTAWTEDNVNVYKSLAVVVRLGLIHGNNSPSGVGVIFDGDTSTGLVEDVDAVHMGNGCFSNIAGAEGNVFRRTRCRDNICTSQQGRGVPSSNALMWCGKPGLSALRIESSTYFAACNPGNIVWPLASFVVHDVTNASFTPRAPLALSMCWE
jgi:hypothetical protein